MLFVFFICIFKQCTLAVPILNSQCIKSHDWVTSPSSRTNTTMVAADALYNPLLFQGEEHCTLSNRKIIKKKYYRWMRAHVRRNLCIISHSYMFDSETRKPSKRSAKIMHARQVNVISVFVLYWCSIQNIKTAPQWMMFTSRARIWKERKS